MEAKRSRDWVARIGIAALFMAFGALGSCDTEGATGVKLREAPTVQKARGSVTADTTQFSPEDGCYLVDGQWVCN